MGQTCQKRKEVSERVKRGEEWRRGEGPAPRDDTQFGPDTWCLGDTGAPGAPPAASLQTFTAVSLGHLLQLQLPGTSLCSWQSRCSGVTGFRTM